jgi:hypothetical protein
MTKIIEKIYSILTKRRYNRGEPHLKTQLENAIEYFVENNQPIKLVGFWGTGPKEKYNWADMSSCEFLSKLNNEVKEVHPNGIEFTFIFATLHGVHNGYNKKSIFSYTKTIENIFERFGFKHVYLDDLWKKYSISFEKINEIYNAKSKDWWNEIEHREIIENNAESRNIELPPQVAAQKYFIMRDLEKEMLKKEFSGYIFHAFSDPKLKNVLPDMPALYFYAREGWSDTPWFVTEE